jgi:intracellular sulfur oxidation DsrE/DsrF family protein
MQLTIAKVSSNFIKNTIMEKTNLSNNTDRRGFLGTLTTGAAAMSIASLLTPFQQVHANTGSALNGSDDPDEWFKKLNGKKHKIVFDATRPHEIMPFVWPRIFLITNSATGSAEKECGVVVILRHDAIPYAFQDHLWAKYKFADVFKAGEIGPAFQAADAATAASVRNPFWKPKKGDFKAPGFGDVAIGINELQDSGVMFCVCNAAMTVYANALAPGMKMDAADVLKEWMAGLLPGVQVVPSGVWAVGRAQEHGCTYCFAG